MDMLNSIGLMKNIFEVFIIFLRLGLSSFGGPIAHLSYFHNEFVTKRKWFDEHSYADLVALCQFLPGPASSQVGIAIGLSRAGIPGAIAAWIGFTVPSAILLIAFALGISNYSQYTNHGLLHGLKVVAVAIVAHAIWGMGKKLCPDFKRAMIAIVAAIIALLIPSTTGQVTGIILGAVIGTLLIKEQSELPLTPLKVNLTPIAGFISLILFFCFLFILPLSEIHFKFESLKLFNSFFRAGSLVFGGGHVVLPLLKAEVVTTGWVSSDNFMAGYGAAQAVPGPLFTFASYLGAISKFGPSGITGAFICLIGAFLPSFFFVFGTLPFWEQLRKIKKMRHAMLGINAAVVGLLMAAFYTPVWTSAIYSIKDFVLALFCFILLKLWNFPSWGIVLIGAIIGGLFLI